VLPISEKTAEYGQRVLKDLKAIGARASIDESGERIQAKIKVATDEKIPYLLIVGPRDAEGDAVSVRARGIMQDLGSVSRKKFMESLQREISSRGDASVLSEHFNDRALQPT
jgi:threonyl-tRNA synthetase